MTRVYTLQIEPDDDGSLLITCPSIPGVVTFSETEADIQRWAADAIETFLWSSMQAGEPIPPSDTPSQSQPVVRFDLLTSLKLDLYEACRAAGVTRAELARRLGWHREQIDRLFRLNHASRIDQIEAAFKALGREVEITVRAAA